MTRPVEAPPRRNAWPVALVGLAGVLALAVVRVLILNSAAPSGVDGGNWLAFGEVQRSGVAYPPIVPFLFSHLVSLVGASAATTIAAAFAISLPAAAVVLAATWADQPIAGVFGGMFVAASPVLGEAVAWGGYPQTIAAAAAMLALIGLVVFMDRGSRSSGVVFGVAFATVVGTSHLVAVPTAAAAAVILATHLGRSRERMVRAVVAVLVAAIPVALLAGTYAALFATLGLPSAGSADPEQVLGPYWIAYPVALVVCAVSALAVSLGPQDALEPRSRALLWAAAAASIAWGAAFVASGEARLLYDLPTIVPLCLVALVPVIEPLVATRRLRMAVGVAVLAVCTAFVGAGLADFPAQVAFYRVMSAGDVAAMEWLGEQPIEADQVLVADRAGVPIGWWAEGLMGHEALYASQLRWLRFDAERARTRVANVLLYQSGFPDTASAAAMQRAGIRYVLLPFGSAFGVERLGPEAGWRIAFAAGDAVVMAPEPSVAMVAP